MNLEDIEKIITPPMNNNDYLNIYDQFKVNFLPLYKKLVTNLENQYNNYKKQKKQPKNFNKIFEDINNIFLVFNGFYNKNAISVRSIKEIFSLIKNISKDVYKLPEIIEIINLCDDFFKKYQEKLNVKSAKNAQYKKIKNSFSTSALTTVSVKTHQIISEIKNEKNINKQKELLKKLPFKTTPKNLNIDFEKFQKNIEEQIKILKEYQKIFSKDINEILKGLKSPIDLEKKIQKEIESLKKLKSVSNIENTKQRINILEKQLKDLKQYNNVLNNVQPKTNINKESKGLLKTKINPKSYNNISSFSISKNIINTPIKIPKLSLKSSPIEANLNAIAKELGLIAYVEKESYKLNHKKKEEINKINNPEEINANEKTPEYFNNREDNTEDNNQNNSSIDFEDKENNRRKRYRRKPRRSIKKGKSLVKNVIRKGKTIFKDFKKARKIKNIVSKGRSILNAVNVARDAATAGEVTEAVAGAAGLGEMGGTVAALASNPVGWAVAGAAAVGAIGYGLYNLKYGDDKKLIDQLEKVGVVEYNFFGDSKIKDWSRILTLKNSDLAKLSHFNDWSDSTEKTLKILSKMTPKERSVILNVLQSGDAFFQDGKLNLDQKGIALLKNNPEVVKKIIPIASKSAANSLKKLLLRKKSIPKIKKLPNQKNKNTQLSNKKPTSENQLSSVSKNAPKTKKSINQKPTIENKLSSIGKGIIKSNPLYKLGEDLFGNKKNKNAKLNNKKPTIENKLLSIGKGIIESNPLYKLGEDLFGDKKTKKSINKKNKNAKLNNKKPTIKNKLLSKGIIESNSLYKLGEDLFGKTKIKAENFKKENNRIHLKQEKENNRENKKETSIVAPSNQINNTTIINQNLDTMSVIFGIL